MDANEYQQLVDHRKMAAFKRKMREAARQTVAFPNRRDVYVDESILHAHGGVWEYRGNRRVKFCKTTEGLGNKDWLAEWMYLQDRAGGSRFDRIAKEIINCAANDNSGQNALPVVCTDEAITGDDSWFQDELRSDDFSRGFIEGCREAGMALIQGESAPYRFLVKSTPPVVAAPVLSVTVTGIIDPAERLIDGSKLSSGDALIGVHSGTVAANGLSLVIKKGLELPEQFMTKVPGTNNSFGDEILTPMPCFVPVVEALQKAGVDVHAYQMATGNGVGKVAFDHRPFTYHINRWPELHPIFEFLLQIGIPLQTCLETFNWNIGYWVIVARRDADQTVEVIRSTGAKADHLGNIEDGERHVIFPGPNGDIIVPAPAE